jgi:hypothetical protein
MKNKKELTPEQKLQRAEYARKWRRKNPEKASKQSKLYRIRNKEKIKISNKKYREENNEYLQKINKEWYNENKEKVRDVQLNRTFGITLEEYNELLNKQNGVCSICGDPPTIDQKKFSIDHDHITGKIRGILCRGCNVGIGHFKDDPELLRKAINYIKNFRNSQ